MKKILSLLTAVCAVFALCGCQQYEIDILERGAYSREDTQYLDGELEPDYAMSDGTTIEPVTLVDTDGVVAMVLGISNTPQAPLLQMVFDKGNCEQLDFQVDYMLVDGWQVSGNIAADPDAWLTFVNMSREYVKFNGQVVIATGTLAEYGLLDEIHEIEMSYRLVGNSNVGLIAEGVYTAETSNEGEPAPFTCDGPVLLDRDGIRVQVYAFQSTVIAGTEEDCDELALYVENNSDRRIELVIGDAIKYEKGWDEEQEEETEVTAAVIPRQEYSPTTEVPFSGEEDVLPGCRTLGALQTGSLEGGVTLGEDEEMSFSLKIYDYEEYDSYEMPDPLYEETVTLSCDDMFTPG